MLTRCKNCHCQLLLHNFSCQMTAQKKMVNNKKLLTKFAGLAKFTISSKLLTSKNDVLIILCHVCHKDMLYQIYLKVHSCLCLIMKTLRKLFSDVLKRSRKRAVRISIQWLTGKKQSISGILPQFV